MTPDETSRLLRLGLLAEETGPGPWRRMLEGARSRSQSLSQFLALSMDTDAMLRRAQALDLALTAQGMRAVYPEDADWPARLTHVLGRHAPMGLFAAGALGPASGPAVAVVGSRRPGKTTVASVRLLVAAFCRSGHAIISGGAQGIDEVAHRVAFECGSTIIAVPRGIFSYREMPALAGVRPDATRFCALSPFDPNAGWKSTYAIQRNRLIVALGDWTIAADPRDEGGTWSSCRFALALGRPLFFLSDRAGPVRRAAAEKLVRAGAVILDAQSLPSVAEMEAMAREILAAPRPVQEGLFP